MVQIVKYEFLNGHLMEEVPMADDINELDFAQCLAKALSQTGEPRPQKYPITYDKELHDIVGELPLHLRHLYGSLNDEVIAVNKLIDCHNMAPGNLPERKNLVAQYHLSQTKITVMRNIMHVSLYELYPPNYETHKGCVILSDWRVAYAKKTANASRPEDDEGLIGMLVIDLRGGDPNEGSKPH